MKQRPPPPKQLSFVSYKFGQKKRVTRRETFLSELERVVPWARLEALTEPKYPTGGRVGRQPLGVPRMLGMCFQGSMSKPLNSLFMAGRFLSAWSGHARTCVDMQNVSDQGRLVNP